MANYDSSKIDEIKNNNDIVEVIAEYLPLTKKGKNYLALCPFHDDTTPSMNISSEKQIYKCFACGAGGDVINFIKDYQKISYGQALDILAKRSNIDFNFNQPISFESSNQEYYQINQEALNLYHYLLQTSKDEKIVNYLRLRGFNDDIINKFKLGYLSNDNALTKLLTNKGYDLNKAVELGLLRIVNNEYIDNYQFRLIYPIIDVKQRVIGFSARSINGEEPKYINSPESKIFLKHQNLYNLNNALSDNSKDNTIYLCEGPNDVIAYDKVGISNVVCSLGTAFDVQQVQLLKKNHIKKIILSFDGDKAGLKATYNSLKVLKNQNLNINYVSFEKYDPDEYLNLYGSQKFIEQAKKLESVIKFKIDYEYSQINTNNQSEKKEFVVNNVKELASILDDFDKDYYYRYLASLSGLSLELINDYGHRIHKASKANSQQNKIDYEKTNEMEKAAEIILYFIMKDYKYLDIFQREIKSFINPNYRQMVNALSAYYLNNKDFEFSLLAEIVEDHQIIDKLNNIMISYKDEEYGNEQLFADSIKTIKYEDLFYRKQLLEQEMKKECDQFKKIELGAQILVINKELDVIKKEKFK